MAYSIIALDIDGTLLNDDHKLTPRVIAAVRSAAEQGAEIVLCTGRGSSSALPVLNELGMQGTMITHNGSSIVDSATRSVIYEMAIEPELANRYQSYLRERQIHFDMNTSFELYVDSLPEDIAAMYERFHVLPVVRSPEDALPAGTVKLSVYAPSSVLDELERDWTDWAHDLQTIRSGDFFIDIQHPHATKGKALERLAAMRGVARERILAIGNYYNDIGMLSFAGFGIAMDNSPAEVKAEADEATASNNEDGVALALERHVLSNG
ncbi:Cof-type HAD-IIB family hydrolase [Cohnella faecalis]|uniref:HAD family phosphatase n=1 Tax=Cohnella faecalis TaxID=2315694 RepID=A0A398CBV2_9BACL|nr:Cof-type HAD-IIB family hydrolase [Cohnella faecalis]RIE00636.1 HAD family phosphatase [Cohnella faecalis]